MCRGQVFPKRPRLRVGRSYLGEMPFTHRTHFQVCTLWLTSAPRGSCACFGRTLHECDLKKNRLVFCKKKLSESWTFTYSSKVHSKSWLLEIEYLLLKALWSSWLAGLIMVWLFRMTAHGTLMFTPIKQTGLWGEKGTQIPARVNCIKLNYRKVGNHWCIELKVSGWMNCRDFGDLLFIKAPAGQSVNESLKSDEPWRNKMSELKVYRGLSFKSPH